MWVCQGKDSFDENGHVSSKSVHMLLSAAPIIVILLLVAVNWKW